MRPPIEQRLRRCARHALGRAPRPNSFARFCACRFLRYELRCAPEFSQAAQLDACEDPVKSRQRPHREMLRCNRLGICPWRGPSPDSLMECEIACRNQQGPLIFAVRLRGSPHVLFRRQEVDRMVPTQSPSLLRSEQSPSQCLRAGPAGSPRSGSHPRQHSFPASAGDERTIPDRFGNDLRFAARRATICPPCTVSLRRLAARSRWKRSPRHPRWRSTAARFKVPCFATEISSASVRSNCWPELEAGHAPAAIAPVAVWRPVFHRCRTTSGGDLGCRNSST